MRKKREGREPRQREAAVSGGHRHLVALAIAIVVVGALPQLMLGALAASIIRDTQISTAQLGTIFALSSGVSMIVARLGGSVGERWGWRRAAKFAGVLSMTSLLGIAAVGDGVWTLSAFMAVGASAQAVAAPTANLLLARELGERVGGTAMGLKQSAVPAAAIIAGASVPVFALTIGWRWAFAATALMVSAVPLLVRGRAELPTETAPPAPDDEPRAEWTAAQWQRRPTLLQMGVAGFLGTFTAYAYNAFFVVSSVERGVSEALAATLFAISGVACLVVRIASGAAADRMPVLGRHPLTVAGAMLATGMLGVGLLATGMPELIAVGSVITYAAGWGWPALYHLAIVRYFADEPAKATGSLRIGLAGGAMVGPFVYGLVSTATSYSTAWLLAAIVGGSGAVALVRSERPLRVTGES